MAALQVKGTVVSVPESRDSRERASLLDGTEVRDELIGGTGDAEWVGAIRFFVLLDHRLHPVKFLSAKAMVLCKPHGIEPDPGVDAPSLHEDVRRLMPLGRVEEEPIWSVP